MRQSRIFWQRTAAALIFMFLCATLPGQENLFWDFPEAIGQADGGRFPELINAGGRMALVWQEFQGEKGSVESTISIRALYSDDGYDWNGPVVTVAEEIPYLWMEEVPLFSAASGSDGKIVVAVVEALSGVALYKENPAGDFFRTEMIDSGTEAADTAVAPRLRGRGSSGFILFLTRRTSIEGASRPTTLTVFTSVSNDGENWSDPELFVQPGFDTAEQDAFGNRTVLEQNFLPTYLTAGGNEYVAFQSLRQGSEGQVYQIYLKTRSSGGSWGPAIPITESLEPYSSIKEPLAWDNQRPHLGLGGDGSVHLTWERRRSTDRPGIASVEISADGLPLTDTVEQVAQDRYTSAYPRAVGIHGETWILWFDDTGIRMARRNSAFNYNVQAASLDAQTPGTDRGSSSFPTALEFNGQSYFLWQDRAGGLERSILLRPDLRIDSPTLRNANFTSGRPGNTDTLVVDWNPPIDSSGVLSHSWKWSRNPRAVPSRAELDQIYGAPNRAVFEIEDTADNEGSWYFSLIARDQAGNWSEPLRLSYSLDITPPPPPVVRSPPTDAYGYLVSNSFAMSWDDAEREPAEYYRWRLDYLASSPEQLDFDVLEALSITDSRNALASDRATETSDESVRWDNLDNGVWAFTVASVDQAGNEGLPSTKVLLTRRYIPVTFITGVVSGKDEADRTFLRISGRGFTVGGRITLGIIDTDGEAPWDYTYTADGGQLRVLSDRTAEIVGIDDMEPGRYQIGVVHPTRGTVFWNRTMQLDSSGNVKFGPFGLYAYESLWVPAARSLRISGNLLLLILLGLLAGASGIITALRLGGVVRDAKKLENDARAILSRGPLTAAAKMEAAAMLRRQGMGLQRKFTFAFGLLVLLTIALIATVLGFVWIRMERDTLAEGLESESRLLVETLSSSAVTSIPAADRGALLLLPDRISALTDALWTTVTGPRSRVVNGTLRATSDGSEFIWASNDQEVLSKIELPATLDAETKSTAVNAAEDGEKELVNRAYPDTSEGAVLNKDALGEDSGLLIDILRRANILPSDLGLGVMRIDDELSEDIELMRQEAEQAVQDAGITRMISELTVLEQQYADLAQEVVLTLDFDNPAYLEAEGAVAAQKKEIETLLLEVSNQFFASYPDFNAEALRSRAGDEAIIFYKPLMYRSGDQDSSFFRGTVRLAVTTDAVRESLARVQRRILIITGLASLAALAAGILVALFISSLIVRPITALVQSVKLIQEQPDMLQHEGFDVGIETGDELSVLGDSINGMVHGLVQAAIEQKELVAGQEIQKAFLPLEVDEKGEKKLSTGTRSNAFFKLFGYYEGADAVSGDYFDFRQLDEDHYVMIKLDIAGHGVTAAMIMVQVAALYVDYFRKVRIKAEQTGRLSYDLRKFTFGINDILNEIGFKGRFAAFNLSVMNVRTSEYEMINAGDNLVRIFDGKTRKINIVQLPGGPAAGQIDSFMIEMNPDMYKVIKGQLNRGDIMFLYTDGIEEAHHIFRDETYNVAEWDKFDPQVIADDQRFLDEGYKTLDVVEESNFAREEFDTKRIDDLLEAVLNKGSYILERRCDLTLGKPLHFDFSSLDGTEENAVMALASVEKVFRIIPERVGNTSSRVRVDKKIDAFLKAHFAEYDEFYDHPVDEDEGYIYFSHMKEDPQDDDLTIWAYQRL